MSWLSTRHNLSSEQRTKSRIQQSLFFNSLSLFNNLSLFNGLSLFTSLSLFNSLSWFWPGLLSWKNKSLPCLQATSHKRQNPFKSDLRRLKMKKWLFMKKWLIHCKNAYKVMVLVKKSYQEDPFAVIFVVVAWPEVAYGIDFYKKCSKRDFSKIVPMPDRSFLKSSRALPEPIWTRISRSRRWDTSRSPKSTEKKTKY